MRAFLACVVVVASFQVRAVEVACHCEDGNSGNSNYYIQVVTADLSGGSWAYVNVHEGEMVYLDGVWIGAPYAPRIFYQNAGVWTAVSPALNVGNWGASSTGYYTDATGVHNFRMWGVNVSDILLWESWSYPAVFCNGVLAGIGWAAICASITMVKAGLRAGI